MPVGDGSNAGTAGTLRDLTLAMVDSATQQCWQAGGKPSLGIMSGNVKAYFATLSQGGTGNAVVAQNIQNVTSAESVTIMGAVDVYRTNFGTIQLFPDQFGPVQPDSARQHGLYRTGTVAIQGYRATRLCRYRR